MCLQFHLQFIFLAVGFDLKLFIELFGLFSLLGLELVLVFEFVQLGSEELELFLGLGFQGLEGVLEGEVFVGLGQQLCLV